MRNRPATCVLTVLLATCGAAILLAPASHAQQIYCIDGSSTSQQWAWRITGGGDTCGNNFTGPVTPVNEPADEQQFAIVFRDSIAQACDAAGAPILDINVSVASGPAVSQNCPNGDWSAAFVIQATQAFTLGVAPAGVTPLTTPCAGGSNGVVGNLSTGGNCNFNPQIARGEPAMPSLGDWGRIALVVLVLATSAWILTRRTRRSERPA